MNGYVVLGFLASLLLSIVATPGCQPNAAPPPPQSSEAEVKQYELTGKVVAVGEDRKSVTIDHEDIAGLMKGMEMNFKVSDPKVLSDIQSGDQVRGHLKVESGNYIVTHLKKQ